MIKMLALNVSPMLSSGNEIFQENRKPYLRKSKSLKDPCEEKELRKKNLGSDAFRGSITEFSRIAQKQRCCLINEQAQ
jgi:hypothetical protein